MLFNSLAFVLFLTVAILVYWLLPRLFAQNLFLLAASLFFYAVGEPVFLGLLLACVGVSYLGGIGIEVYPRARRWILSGILVSTLGALALFKYYNFFMGSVSRALEWVGIMLHPETLAVGLPIGISFFTFQTVGYVVDVYRGKVPSERNAVDYFLFVCYFPQLVAGPIERSDHLLPQVKKSRMVTPDDVVFGVFLMAQGFVKKVVIADNLAPMVNLLFSSNHTSGPLVVVALLAFAFQIYGDFSGYTDIARGVARLFGFKILLNFRAPYAASSVTDFWRRWHITLSTWFRDYLYFPLGGNRRGRLRTYINVFVTMLVSGLWHGASYTFLLWGAYHGGLVCAHKGWQEVAPQRSWRETWWYRWLARGFTFLLVLYGWLFFRAGGASQCLAFSKALLFDWQHVGVALLLFLQIVPFLALAVLIDIVETRWTIPQESRLQAGWLLVPYLSLLLLCLYVGGSIAGGDFIYFRF